MKKNDNIKKGKLADTLNSADIERRKANDAADQLERADEIAREKLAAKIAFMEDMPDDTPAGSVDEFMFKEGVNEQLELLDRDLVGLRGVKDNVRQVRLEGEGGEGTF